MLSLAELVLMEWMLRSLGSGALVSRRFLTPAVQEASRFKKCGHG